MKSKVLWIKNIKPNEYIDKRNSNMANTQKEVALSTNAHNEIKKRYECFTRVVFTLS